MLSHGVDICFLLETVDLFPKVIAPCYTPPMYEFQLLPILIGGVEGDISFGI